MPIYAVKTLCRHKEMKTTERYAHLSPDHLQASVHQAFAPREDTTPPNGMPDEA